MEPLAGRELISTQDAIDEAGGKLQTGIINTDSSATLPPAEIYEPLAIPLHLAPQLDASAQKDPVGRSNEPVAIVPKLSGTGRNHSDTELMRLLHDVDRSAMAEEQLRSRGFDSLRLEIARRLTHEDPAVRRELADSISQIGGVDPRPWLEELAVDPDSRVRRIAISILGTSGDPAVDRWLQDLRSEETDPQVAELIDGILQKRR